VGKPAQRPVERADFPRQPTLEHAKERNMKKSVRAVILVSASVVAGTVAAQGLLMDIAVNRVISKYQSATCEQLWQQRGQPKSQEEQRVLEFLRNDPQARTEFFNRIAGPVVNKMFECGMIP
jgi:cytochrome c-type biogenesis protein CcmH/NrfG